MITFLNFHLYAYVAVAAIKNGLSLEYQKTNITLLRVFFFSLVRISYLKALLTCPDDLCRLQKVVVMLEKMTWFIKLVMV